jgi:hypothetical protein
MRKDFEKIDGIRTFFIGTFVKFGKKHGYNGYILDTLLLKNIKCCDDKYNNIKCDHIWFTMTKGFEKLNIKQLEKEKNEIKIKFNARVKPYMKGYNGYDELLRLEKPLEIDYKLSHPTKIQIQN